MVTDINRVDLVHKINAIDINTVSDNTVELLKYARDTIIVNGLGSIDVTNFNYPEIIIIFRSGKINTITAGNVTKPTEDALIVATVDRSSDTSATLSLVEKSNITTVFPDGNDNSSKIVLGAIDFSSSRINWRSSNVSPEQMISHINDSSSGRIDESHLDTDIVLIDGSRAFTGKISGITPTDPTHLATKSYVDALIQGLDWQESVLDKDLTTPPTLGGGDAGKRYLIPSGASAPWDTHQDEIAEWDGAAWVYSSPTEGFAVWVEDEDKTYTWNGTSWVKFGSTIDHTQLQNIGVKTHVEIDSHINASSDEHGVGASSDIVGTETVQTIKNKTLDGTNSIDASGIDVNINTAFNKNFETVIGNIKKIANSAALGSSGKPAHSETVIGNIKKIANSAALGSSGKPAHSDHVHKGITIARFETSGSTISRASTGTTTGNVHSYTLPADTFSEWMLVFVITNATTGNPGSTSLWVRVDSTNYSGESNLTAHENGIMSQFAYITSGSVDFSSSMIVKGYVECHDTSGQTGKGFLILGR